MRTITPTPTPPICLVGAQAAGQNWRAFMQTPCHVRVAGSLRGDQHHLCCYCEVEIAETDSHVEHLVPRSRDFSRSYDYGNLAASCNSGGVEERHCGHRKGGEYDPGLFVSPHDPASEELFRYLPDGSIQAADPQNSCQADYMRTLLALDCPALTGRRHRHAKLLIETLGSSPTVEIVAWAQSFYLQPNDGGRLHQFHSLSRELLS